MEVVEAFGNKQEEGSDVPNSFEESTTALKNGFGGTYGLNDL